MAGDHPLTSNPVGTVKLSLATPKDAEFERFEDLASKLVQVPKKELDEQRKPA